MKRNIIIDCDPGQDDAVAITVALANQDKLNILGISTIAGNQTVEKTANNALKVLEYCGYPEIPVAKGYESSLLGVFHSAGNIHGESGLDGPNFPPLQTSPVKQHALDFLKEKIEKSEQLVTIVTMGPLTNIAVLLKTYPYLSEKIEQIVTMGGGIYSGNILPKAEFNIWQDPEAAKIVFESAVPIVLVPIEACAAGCIDLDRALACKGKGKISDMFAAINDFYSRRCTERTARTNIIFDLTTIIYLLSPEIFKSEDMVVYVETEGKNTRGMTVCDFRNRADKNAKRIKVLTDVDNARYNELLYEAIEKLDKKFAQ